MSHPNTPDQLTGTAIVGMACRFPGARDVAKFWQNLQGGVESISFFSDQELETAGVDRTTLRAPNFVKARSILEDIELFDASFFDVNPREAQVLDPQHRLFLECAWEALESAGCEPETCEGRIGVYAGADVNLYLLNNLLSSQAFMASVGTLQVLLGNDKDYLSARVSYKLNLKGPSITVQTACSTSLVAMHLACESLLTGECDVALAGGVSVSVPQKTGYFYTEGDVASPDGHCRAFDASARGTVFGSGVGVVVLKRLEDALKDGSHIRAVVRGSAVNHDGSSKIGFTAPGVDGQTAVIVEALDVAGVDPETVSYVEAHGTGTELGDPIEVAALIEAFRLSTEKSNFCALGSVKTNVGHLSTAAGIAGLIKTVLALEHKMIPPSLHFERPNPKIDFANSPFYVNAELREWRTDGYPRRAGVSSFGMGGTNAHVVLEEAPEIEPSGESRCYQQLTLSARTETALERVTDNLVAHLQTHPDLNLADVAYTLHVGRQAFEHRRVVVCKTMADAIAALQERDPARALTNAQVEAERSVVFMFSGQGAQYVNMERDLYEREPSFCEQVDTCAKLLKSHLGLDLRDVLYPEETGAEQAAEQLEQTWLTQPALFVVEYALAQLWMSWGVKPAAMIGHSIGEYVAACLAGVLELENALALVAARGRLMQELPGGVMLAVFASEEEIGPHLGQRVSLAAVNGPSWCAVSGPTEAMEELERELTEQGVSCRRLHTSHAFHSPTMEPILEPFEEQVRQVQLREPRIPYISNVTGTWITSGEATAPAYWARHLRQTVRFSEGVQELLTDPRRVLLEVGPGNTLSTLVRQHTVRAKEQVVIASVRHPQDRQSDEGFLLRALGRLWLAGVTIDWAGFYANERRHRVPLPTYPFERQRYWIEPTRERPVARPVSRKKPDVGDWFYVPIWKQSVPPEPGNLASQQSRWLVFCDACGLGSQIVERLEQAGRKVVTVIAGEGFRRVRDGMYAINPRIRGDYDDLLDELRKLDRIPQRIVHLWNVTPAVPTQSSLDRLEETQDLGFYSILFLAQALGKQLLVDPTHIVLVSSNMQSVVGGDALYPEKALLLGPCRVIPQECDNLTCRSIDVAVLESGMWQEGGIVAELAANSSDPVVAYRGGQRWVQTYEPVRLDPVDGKPSLLREGGVYLITGGLGGIGLLLAEHLAREVRAKLVLTSRSGLPPREEWKEWVADDAPLSPTWGTQAEHTPRIEIAGETLSRLAEGADSGLIVAQHKAPITSRANLDEKKRQIRAKIKKVQELEALDAEVLIAGADVADQEQMRDLVDQVCERFGTIHGVIHTAVITGGSTIRQEVSEDAAAVLAPQVKGTLVLEEVLRDVNLDFLVLFSSLSAVMGGIGQVYYCAANAFLDAFAHQSTSRREPFTVSANWDRWQDVGTAIAVQKRHKELTGEELPEAILSREGIDVFDRILSRRLNRVLVSTQDLHIQIGLARHVAHAALDLPEKSEWVRPSEPSHPRPALANDYVEPRDEIEETLADIWGRLLGVERVGIHDNFFELDGDSLLAVRLMARIQECFGKRLPVSTLFQGATIERLATILRQQDNSCVWSPVVGIQPNGSKPPFFCVHPGAGTVLCFVDLARHLGPDQPFYGLQAPGVEGEQEPLTQVEDLAAHYIEALRVIQPEGPYFLGGWSFGGAVAFEMAQQLHREGQKIGLLAVLDTTAPTSSNIDPVRMSLQAEIDDDVEMLSGLARNLGVFLGSPVKTLPVSYDDLRRLGPDEQFDYVLKKARMANLLPADFGLWQLRSLLQVANANARAVLNYIPQVVYPNKIVLFRVNEEHDDSLASPDRDPTLGWSELSSKPVECHVISGTHLTLVNEPHVQFLAEQLRRCLDEAQDQTRRDK